MKKNKTKNWRCTGVVEWRQKGGRSVKETRRIEVSTVKIPARSTR